MDTENDKYWRARLSEAEKTIYTLRTLVETFANACEMDGFGDVRDAHYGELSQALRDFKAKTNA